MKLFRKIMSLCLIITFVIGSIPLTANQAYAISNNYHYDKYSVDYQLGAWSDTTYVASYQVSPFQKIGLNQATHSDYSISSNGTINGIDKTMKHYTSMSGYVIEGVNTIYDVYPGSISNETIQYSIYTEYKYTYNARKATVQESKTFVESIIAPEGTYPVDGIHSDGYYYIRMQKQNMKPTLTISTADNQTIASDSDFLISGEMNDLDLGTSVSLLYTLKQNGQTIIGRNDVHLLSITSDRFGIPFNDLSISLSDLDSGLYTIDFYAKDEFDSKSEITTLNFEITTSNQAPILILENTNDITITEGETVVIAGNMLDSNIGANISLKYSLYQSGNVVSGHNAVELEAFTATGLNQVITTGTVDVSSVAGGDYILRVWAENQSSVKSSETSINLRIDVKSPKLELNILNDNDQMILKDQNYQIDGEVKGIDSGDIVSVKYTLKKSGTIVDVHENQEIHTVTADGTKQGFSHTLSLSGLSVGSYTIELQATDQNSQVSTIQTEAFTIYARPELTITSSTQQSVFKNENIVISANVLDYDSGEIVTTRYSAYNNSGSPILTHQNIQIHQYTSTGSNQTISNYVILMDGTFPVGDYYILIKSTDAAGHESTIHRVDVNVKGEAVGPNFVITNLDAQELGIGDLLEIQGTISDQNINDQYFINYSVFDTDNNVITGYENVQLSTGSSTQANQSISETLNVDALGIGSYSIKVQAKDSTNLLSESYTISFSIVDNFNQLSYSVRTNKNSYVIIDGRSVKGSVNKKLTVEYPVDAVTLIDVNAITAQEDVLVGNVQNSNIEILENDTVAGKLVIRINKSISAGKEWTGTFNIIKFKGLIDQDIKIRYTIEDI